MLATRNSWEPKAVKKLKWKLIVSVLLLTKHQGDSQLSHTLICEL